jgi:hypothetical protein
MNAKDEQTHGKVTVTLPKFNIPKLREQGGIGFDPITAGERKTANWLAKGVLIIFGIVAVFLLIWTFIAMYRGVTGTEAAEMGKTLLPYLATPLGVALGYYFTRQDNKND